MYSVMFSILPTENGSKALQEATVLKTLTLFFLKQGVWMFLKQGAEVFELLICKDKTQTFIFTYYIVWHVVLPQFLFVEFRKKSLLQKSKDWVNKRRVSAIMKDNFQTLKIVTDLSKLISHHALV